MPKSHTQIETTRKSCRRGKIKIEAVAVSFHEMKYMVSANIPAVLPFERFDLASVQSSVVFSLHAFVGHGK